MKYKALMDVEFYNPAIEKIANKLSDIWYQCPECDDAWEDTTDNEMTRCPKCNDLVVKPEFVPNVDLKEYLKYEHTK